MLCRGIALLVRQTLSLDAEERRGDASPRRAFGARGTARSAGCRRRVRRTPSRGIARFCGQHSITALVTVQVGTFLVLVDRAAPVCLSHFERGTSLD